MVVLSPPGNDQGVDAVNILELTHLAGRCTQAGNSGHMLAKGSRKSQNAYAKLRHYQPRSCMRSAEGMVEISIPTHGFAQIARDFGQHGKVVVVGHGLQ